MATRKKSKPDDLDAEIAALEAELAALEAGEASLGPAKKSTGPAPAGEDDGDGDKKGKRRFGLGRKKAADEGDADKGGLLGKLKKPKGQDPGEADEEAPKKGGLLGKLTKGKDEDADEADPAEGEDAKKGGLLGKLTKGKDEAEPDEPEDEKAKRGGLAAKLRRKKEDPGTGAQSEPEPEPAPEPEPEPATVPDDLQPAADGARWTRENGVWKRLVPDAPKAILRREVDHEGNVVHEEPGSEADLRADPEGGEAPTPDEKDVKAKLKGLLKRSK